LNKLPDVLEYRLVILNFAHTQKSECMRS